MSALGQTKIESDFLLSRYVYLVESRESEIKEIWNLIKSSGLRTGLDDDKFSKVFNSVFSSKEHDLIYKSLSLVRDVLLFFFCNLKFDDCVIIII